MPIYEYQCQKCGHEFEREQRIVEDPIKKCPSCKAQKAKRLISKTSFVLKGGGWYNDLYSSTGSDDKGGADKSDSDSSSSDSSDSSDSTSSDDGKSSKKKEKAANSDSKTDSKKKKKDSGKKKSAA